MVTGESVEFLRKLIQTPSLPGQEQAVAELVLSEMQSLGFDEARTDEAGNVIGLIRGECSSPRLMLNTHLDHVDPGDPSCWPYPPYGAVVADDRVRGRGAVDIKGPLAAQVYAAGSLKAGGRRPPSDVLVSAVVQEEVGGAGARFLAENLEVDLVIVGEPSRNQLRRGHRGRFELVLTIGGRSAHASLPDHGVNPLQVVAAFIMDLPSVERGSSPVFGSSSCVPTLIRSDQSSANVIPGAVELTLDWRSVPEESVEVILNRLLELATRCRIDGSTVDVRCRELELQTYTGMVQRMVAAHPGFCLPEDDRYLVAAEEILHRSIGLDSPPGIWKFATDGGHFAAAGLKVLGFGPGDDALAHTVRESIGIEEVETAIRGYRALLLELPYAVPL